MLWTKLQMLQIRIKCVCCQIRWVIMGHRTAQTLNYHQCKQKIFTSINWSDIFSIKNRYLISFIFIGVYTQTLFYLHRSIFITSKKTKKLRSEGISPNCKIVSLSITAAQVSFKIKGDLALKNELWQLCIACLWPELRFEKLWIRRKKNYMIETHLLLWYSSFQSFVV